jgi:hypothetical protein
MSYFKVYVAAPYDDAPAVREAHGWLRANRFIPVSSWADKVEGPERLDLLTSAQCHAIAEGNDRDLLSAHALLVLSRAGAGGEMFGEARLALEFGIPVVWVGSRRPLTAYRRGVVRVYTREAGLEQLLAFARLAGRHDLYTDDDLREVLWSAIEGVAPAERA